MAYNFIQDFIEYGSGSECPISFIRWASLLPLSVAAGRRYFTKQGRLIRSPELCLVFVAPSGGKKSYGKDLAKEVITDAFPDHPIAADITSRDDLVNLICSEETLRFYINHEGAELPWHPIVLYIDEMRHFMSYSPSAMISFMVAILGQKHFKSSTRKRGKEEAEEPCLNLIGCTTPDWIVEHLKSGILAGGWSRRFIVIYEPKRTEKPIPRPQAPTNELELRRRMREHLRKIERGCGEFVWTPEANEFFDAWYVENWKNVPEDQHLAAYYTTKDIHLDRICMSIALAEENPKLVITKQLLELGLSFFDPIELLLPQLYLAGGRNELAVPQQRLLDLLERVGGGMTKKELMRAMQKDLSPMEQLHIVRFLEDSGQIYRLPVDGKGEMFLLPKKAVEIKKNGGKWI